MHLDTIEKMESAVGQHEVNKNYLNAAFLSESVLQRYISHQTSWVYKQEIKFRKKKIRDLNKKAQKYFHTVSGSIEVSQENWKEILDVYLNLEDVNEVYRLLGTRHLIKYSEVEEYVQATDMPIFVQIAGVCRVDEKGNISKRDWGEQQVKDMYYNMRAELAMNKMASIFEVLMVKWKITGVSMVDYLITKGVINNKSVHFKVSHWVARFFEGDVFSAIHILLPVFEEIVLDLSERLGIDTISLPRDRNGIKLRDAIVNKNFFESNEVKSKFPIDMRFQLSYILYDDGWNLRNLIMHGQAQYEWLTWRYIWCVIIRCFLILAAFVERKE